MKTYISYLMGAENITDNELLDLGVEIVETKNDGDRALKISETKLPAYIELIKTKLTNGFWNEVVGEEKIIFIFKLKDGSVKEYVLSEDNESEISKLCSDFTGEPAEKTSNVYKYISGNAFYRECMMEHYSSLIAR